jgi:hypothetical protein
MVEILRMSTLDTRGDASLHSRLRILASSRYCLIRIARWPAVIFTFTANGRESINQRVKHMPAGRSCYFVLANLVQDVQARCV